jgi:predicted nuclease with RNAse H fold
MSTTGAVLLTGTDRPTVASASVLAKAPTAERAERGLLELIEDARPGLVAVDAPLTLPPCLSCPSFCRGPSADLCELRAAQEVWQVDGHPVTERLCEVLLRDELPSGPLPTMRIAQIAARGVALARRVLAGGTRLGAPGAVEVLEVYPYATLWRLAHNNSQLRPRNPDEGDQEFSERILAALASEIDGLDQHQPHLDTSHGVDALIAAYTGWLHPDGLEPPPADFNLASGWIWLPRPSEEPPPSLVNA